MSQVQILCRPPPFPQSMLTLSYSSAEAAPSPPADSAADVAPVHCCLRFRHSKMISPAIKITAPGTKTQKAFIHCTLSAHSVWVRNCYHSLKLYHLYLYESEKWPFSHRRAML